MNRNRCQYCRLKKCLELGMSRDGKEPKVLIRDDKRLDWVWLKLSSLVGCPRNKGKRLKMRWDTTNSYRKRLSRALTLRQPPTLSTPTSLSKWSSYHQVLLEIFDRSYLIVTSQSFFPFLNVQLVKQIVWRLCGLTAYHNEIYTGSLTSQYPTSYAYEDQNGWFFFLNFQILSLSDG